MRRFWSGYAYKRHALVTVLTWLQEKGYDVSFSDLAEDTRLTAWIELLDI